MENEGEILDMFRYLVEGVFLVIGLSSFSEYFTSYFTGPFWGHWMHWQPPLHHYLYTKNGSKVIPPPHAFSRYL